MKNTTLFIAALLLSVLGYSQTGTVIVSQDSICKGQSVTAEAMAPELDLATPTGTNNHNGVMFDVSATYDAIITGFLVSPLSNNSTFYVYYRTGSHVGNENSATGWTLLDSVTGVPSGTDVNPGFSMSQAIVAGQTLAFYVTTKGTNYMYYSNGTTVGTTLASDSYLTIKEGVGKAYPFAGTFSPRNLVGSVLYMPDVTTYSWSTGQTSAQISPSPNRSKFYVCDMDLSGGGTATGSATVHVKDVEVDVTANPSTIQSGQSSTLMASVSMERGVATLPSGSNSQNGAMFDMTASKSLSINGFTVSKTDATAGDIEVFYKTGTHVGHEGNSNSWTSIGTFTGVTGGHGRYLQLSSPIAMVAGQTIAAYITRTDAGGRLHYDNGTNVGDVASSASGLAILEGTGIAYPFGTTYAPRVLNTIVHFEVDPVTNATFNWSSGGSSASVVVSPTSTTNYTVDVGVGGCNKTGNVSVTVGNIGIDENVNGSYSVFPNPANNHLVVQFTNNNEETQVNLIDLSGKTVYSTVVDASHEELIIQVSDLAKGLYLLRLEQNGTPAVIKVNVM